MEENHSIVGLVILLLACAMGATVLIVFIVYHIRFLIDSINNQALGSGRLLWFLCLFFFPPWADLIYFGAVWSKRPKPRPKEVTDESG